MTVAAAEIGKAFPIGFFLEVFIVTDAATDRVALDVWICCPGDETLEIHHCYREFMQGIMLGE